MIKLCKFFLPENRIKLFCKKCNLLIHEGEILWVSIGKVETPFCPIHVNIILE